MQNRAGKRGGLAHRLRLVVKTGDALCEPADVLVCSANVFLNLSGGVGGELLRRYGDQMQAPLREFMQSRGIRHVPQGEVVSTPGFSGGFRHILHAVAVDAWYESSPAVVAEVLSKALSRCDALGATKVVLVALATGYGRLSFEDFATGLAAAAVERFGSVRDLCLVVRSVEAAERIAAVLQRSGVDFVYGGPVAPKGPSSPGDGGLGGL